ncbi:protein kinase [Achlya hypogyna]|uniref:Centriolar satellite-associated tubulin polyglutamylase complex regulator 1 n=1 Tax=Achlya hypogyna TaxID=1202772 RepID=A0A1V9ZST2_ACHHY|nr:protein kinase [Achlya hypogyna]
MGGHRARKVLRASLLLRPDASLDILSGSEYLERTCVKAYLDDALKGLLAERPENPTKYLAKYFARVVTGAHVDGRNFEFVDLNVRNRLAFVSLVEASLSNVDDKYEMTIDDFHQLVAIICPGLPRMLLVQACGHLLEAEMPTEIPFKRLLTCFRACLVYNEFLGYVYGIYCDLARAEKMDDDVRRKDMAQAKLSEAVVIRLRDEHHINHEKFTCPPLSVVEACMYTSATFKQFCGTLVEHVAIDAAITELQAAYERVGEAALRKGETAGDGPDADMLKATRKVLKRRASKTSKRA